MMKTGYCHKQLSISDSHETTGYRNQILSCRSSVTSTAPSTLSTFTLQKPDPKLQKQRHQHRPEHD